MAWRSRYIRASLLGSIGWRASLAAACRARLRGVRAGLGRASAGSSLTAGLGARPPVAGGKCMAWRSRYIRASLLGSIGWRASLAAACRARLRGVRAS
jgi:hypothetical protein